MSIVADRVRESTSTTGTGTLTLDGAPTGFRSFTGAFGNGVSVYYAIVGGAEWEIGIGTTGAGTLARDTVLASSAGGTTPVSFSAGVKDVFNTAPAAGLVLVGQLASTNTPSTVVLRDASGNFSAGTITASLTGSISGNAATATALQTPRNINGVSFNGTADITVPAAAGTLTGNTLAAGVTASSLTSVGTLSSLTVTGNLTVDTNTLFVNAVNNRVGIGSASPGYDLDIERTVNGPVYARVRNNDTSSAAFTGLVLNSSGNSWGMRMGSVANNINALTFDLDVLVAPSTKLTLDSSGNVGIGVTPTQRLHVSGTTLLAGALTFTADNTHDIGASGATRPRDVFIARRANIDGITVGRGGQTTVSSNTAVGSSALNSASLTGTNNTAMGVSALQSNTTGGSNSAVGLSALQSNTTGGNNSAVGLSALQNNTTGNFNSAVGVNALLNNTTGANNSAVGSSALRNNTTGAFNIAVGSAAMFNNTTGDNNTAVGREALVYNTTGASNSAVGREALRRIAGSNNVAVGFESGIAISRGVATLGAIVGGSLYTDGTYNNVNLVRSSGSTFDAVPTANITVSGGAVTAVTLVTGGSGFQSTDTVLTAIAATIGGTGSGFTVAVATLTGAVSSDNTLLGYRAANTQTEGSGNIAIGASVQLDSLTGSNQINIGTRYFHDRIRLLERSTDPAKPAEGNVVLWMSDGTGLGDDGDVLIGSTAGGVTNYAILFDHSAGTLWP